MADQTPAVLEDENTTVVALTPAEMVPAQHELIAWCDRKIRALTDEADELVLHHKLALDNGWKTLGRRLRYQSRGPAHQLLHEDARGPRRRLPARPEHAGRYLGGPVSDSKWHTFTAVPQARLPVGAGRYVDETLKHLDMSFPVDDGKGGRRQQTHLVSDDYDEVDFPVRLMKPRVLEAAARAMALKVFDQLGIVHNGGGDPILVGELLDPRGNHRRATFFIAWWVETRTL